MTERGLNIVVLFGILFAFVVNAQIQYGVMQLQDGECVAVAEGVCTKCGSSFYKANIEGNIGYYEVYSDSACSLAIAGTYEFGASECAEQSSNCSLYLTAVSYSYYTATFSTSQALKVVSYLDDSDEFIALQLAKTTATLTGTLKGTEIQTSANNNRFFFEALLTPQKYSSSFGVFNFGQTYTKNDLTFVINRHANETTPYTPAGTPEYSLAIDTMTNLEVVSTTEVYNIGIYPFGLFLIETNSQYDLTGLTIGFLNVISISNLSAYPPAYSSDDDAAHLVGQVDDSIYWTFPCDMNDQIIECSLSFTISSSSFSFSLEMDGQEKQQKDVDEMSFSLF